MKNSNCYIHIPFCTSKCKYCRFASFSWLKEIQVQNYINFLCREILDSEVDNETLDTIYFWWGTPWVLSLSQFSQIFLSLKQKFIFSENIEISIETTPENVNEKNIIWWKNLWINRISMWLQTLNENSLIEIWRAWKGDIINALDLFKYFISNPSPRSSVLPLEKEEINWIINISIDFIVWLPFVSKWEIIENIGFLFKKYDFIKHISVYMLEEYYDIPEDIESKFDNIKYPNNWKNNWILEEEIWTEYLSIKKFLIEKWFNSYEISNFSKSWYECKHNIWYWNHKETFAFWLWAHWFLNSTRFSNSESFLEYYNKKNIKKDILNSNDIFLEKMMFSLRTSWIDKKYLEKLDIKKINYFLENNLLIDKWEKIILSNNWIVFMDYILWEII